MAENELSRKDREKLMHRREILDAAERVFVRDGYQAATIERIAQEADFSVGTLYNFFGSKEKLFAEVIPRLVEEVFAGLEEKVFGEPDPMRALDALIDVRLMYPQEHRDFARVFLEVAPQAAEDMTHSLPESCQALYERYVQSVTGIMERGIAAGVFRGDDPRYMTLCLEGAFRLIGIHWIREDSPEPLEARVARVKRILLAMVCKSHGDAIKEKTE